jgi:hypothetical protein
LLIGNSFHQTKDKQIRHPDNPTSSGDVSIIDVRVISVSKRPAGHEKVIRSTFIEGSQIFKLKAINLTERSSEHFCRDDKSYTSQKVIRLRDDFTHEIMRMPIIGADRAYGFENISECSLHIITDCVIQYVTNLEIIAQLGSISWRSNRCESI